MSELKDARISVVIPHYNGLEILEDCLNSLYASTDLPLVVILVDNGSGDGSQAMVRRQFPEVVILQQEKNLGFAGGCNVGIRAADTEYVLILNNDTIHQKGWLEVLADYLDRNTGTAVVQPKLLSYQNRNSFDYSGAAGGEMDIFGFPYARGRMFETIEKDEKQYDRLNHDIFWASGTAFLARRDVLLLAGLFDETFFAHMEEIDLDWRLQLMGYKIAIAPQAVIWHRSGFTLGAESPFKKYLNYRNSLYMFCANYRWPVLLYLFPVRFCLDLMALGFSLLQRDFGRAGSIIKAYGYVAGHLSSLGKKRRHLKQRRIVTDHEVMKHMCKFPVALMYYLGGKKTWADLHES